MLSATRTHTHTGTSSVFSTLYCYCQASNCWVLHPGPWAGKRHDQRALKESGVLESIRTPGNVPPSEHGFKLFGDKGYTSFPPHILATVRRGDYTMFNRNMAKYRCRGKCFYPMQLFNCFTVRHSSLPSACQTSSVSRFLAGLLQSGRLGRLPSTGKPLLLCRNRSHSYPRLARGTYWRHY